MSIPNTITTADPIMKQARFNPSPVTFCNLPTDTLQKIQRFFPLRERATLPLVCDAFKHVTPLVPSEKKKFDKLVELWGCKASLWCILGLATARGDATAIQVIPLAIALGAEFRRGLCNIACDRGHAGVVAVLCEHGADPNRADKDGVTPCMRAVIWGGTACLRALAEGAAQQGKTLDVNEVAHKRRGTGLTALDLAMRRGFRRVATFLRQLGGVTGEEVRRANEGFAREIVENAIDRAIACC